MLIIAKSMGEIRFSALVDVYAASLREKASDWPNLPEGFALQLAEQDFRQYLQEVFFQTNGAFYAIWEEDNHYVSAFRLEPYRDGMLLEALETTPAYRKHGYASMLIREVLRMLAQQNPVRVYSHVNKQNRASLRTHEVCGFHVFSDFAAYINGNVDYRCFTLLYES